MDFQHSHRQQQQQMNAGLTRYRSAPSSYFTSYLDATADTIGSCGVTGSGGGGGGIGGYGMDDLDHFLNRFHPNNNQGQDSNLGNSFSNSTMSLQSQTQFVKQEQDDMQPQQQVLQEQNIQNDYSQVSQMMYQSQSSGQNEDQAQQTNASAIDYSNRSLLSSMNSNQLLPLKMATGGGNSNLIRYNSSPAEVFANINIENEYGAMRGMGNFGAANKANAEASFSSTSRFQGFSTGQSSSCLMSPISEIENKGMGGNNSSNRNFEEGQRNDSCFMTGFPNNSSWDDSTMLSDNFLKVLADDDTKPFSTVTAPDNSQANEGQNKPPPPPTLLSRHMSLPNTSVDFSSVESLMQDSVLCKMRAKRGCATHPRSIAERVRRTRISERMRKLQELVPHMDKQTNTSDMLDFAVDYIKDLQNQVKTLSDNRAKCICSNESGGDAKGK